MDLHLDVLISVGKLVLRQSRVSCFSLKGLIVARTMCFSFCGCGWMDQFGCGGNGGNGVCCIGSRFPLLPHWWFVDVVGFEHAHSALAHSSPDVSHPYARKA